MSDNLYLINIPDYISREIYDQLLSIVDTNKRKTVERYKFASSRNLTLIANVWARLILARRLDCSARDIHFGYGKFGRPSLLNSDIFFNISHSGSWIAIAVSDFPIGVDIEQHCFEGIENVVGNFSTQEIEKLASLDDIKKLNYFFYTWTLKESFLKAKGKGLVEPLDSFSIEDLILSSSIYTESLDVIDCYSVALCKLGSSKGFKRTVVSKEEVFDNLS